MAQPLDIRVTAFPDRGLVVTVEGTELHTAGMENSAVLWGIVSYIVNHLPDDGHMDDLRITAAQITEHFRRQAAIVPDRTRQREEELAEGLAECPLLPSQLHRWVGVYHLPAVQERVHPEHPAQGGVAAMGCSILWYQCSVWMYLRVRQHTHPG